MALTKLELDKSTCDCGTCNNNVLYLHGKCHPGRPVQVRYEHKSGELEIICSECLQLVTKIRVAEPN